MVFETAQSVIDSCSIGSSLMTLKIIVIYLNLKWNDSELKFYLDKPHHFVDFCRKLQLQ